MVNDPFGDPALYVEVLWERRALLFDLGDIGTLRPAKILKISDAFVSHTHIDHFIGFDFLIRLMLNREKTLKIYGPPGFLANVEGRLAGYTWNLTSGYSFAVEAVEIHDDQIRSKTFRSHERFVPGAERIAPFGGVLIADPQMEVQAVLLDHFVPCQAFALKERFHINVHKEHLDRMGFSMGPWLKGFKQALWRGEKDGFTIMVSAAGTGLTRSQEIPLGELKSLVTVTPGQKIVYVADCQYTPENIKKIIGLAEGADLFFCEAAFLNKDQERARERGHLTAGQAGELARMARVKRLEIFHFSPKYENQTQALYGEAEEAFRH